MNRAFRAKDMPRVLVIAHDARATGGVNNFLRVMKKNISARVITTRVSNGPRMGERTKTERLLRTVADYFNFLRIILRRNFDIVHVNPSLDVSSLPRELIFIWIARVFRPRIKRIIFFRGWSWVHFNTILRNPLMASVFRASIKTADLILVLSGGFRDALVPLGVDPARIVVTSTQFEGDELAKALDAGVQRRFGQILFLSRFLKAKGGENLIRAFSSVLHRHPDARLIMAGDGPCRGEWENLAGEILPEDTVVFTGYVTGQAKMRLLAESHIFCLPTTHPEGMPNAILEAMAAGNVIVATSVGGMGRVVKDGVHGAVLSSVATGDIANSLEKYLSSPELSRAIAESNKHEAWSKWEAATVSNSIADHYERLAGRKGRLGSAP